jgi:putative PIN family toxin of toxin-antitoxin system
MRIVPDTNVVVSALIWGGKPFTLLQLATEGTILLYASPALIEELRDVLGRSHLKTRLDRQRSSVEKALSLYIDLAISVSATLIAGVVANDPDDDHVIAAAVGADADLIVSGDRHLLDLGRHGTHPDRNSG